MVNARLSLRNAPSCMVGIVAQSLGLGGKVTERIEVGRVVVADQRGLLRRWLLKT